MSGFLSVIISLFSGADGPASFRTFHARLLFSFPHFCSKRLVSPNAHPCLHKELGQQKARPTTHNSSKRALINILSFNYIRLWDWISWQFKASHYAGKLFETSLSSTFRHKLWNKWDVLLVKIRCHSNLTRNRFSCRWKWTFWFSMHHFLLHPCRLASYINHGERWNRSD